MDEADTTLVALEGVLAAFRTAATITDAAFCVRHANSAFEALAAWSDTPPTGAPLTDILPRESDRLRVRHGAAAATASQPDVTHDVLIGASIDEALRSQLTQRVLFARDGRIAGYLFYLPSPVTGDSTDADMRELLAGLTHDFNNVLTVMSANLASALDHRDPEFMRRHIERALAAVRHASDLTETARTLTSNQPTHAEPIDLGDCARRFVVGARTWIDAQAKIDLHLPQCALEIRGDPVAIERILRNLVMNALEAKATALRISVDANGRDCNACDAIVTVADTGTGIANAIRKRIFAPYVSFKGAGSDSNPHMGFGLAIVKRLMAQMNGEVRLAAPPAGFTTCFALRWPNAARVIQSSTETRAVKR